jgi:RNA polymerase sigma-70 factor (ECF subfamily)
MSDNSGRDSTSKREDNISILSGLYEEYYDKLARYAYLRIGSRADAEDLAGEVFLRALKSIKSYKDQGIPMGAWLFRIAHNLVVDYLRKRQRQKMVPIEEVQIESGVNPVITVEKKLEMERVRKAMEQLTEQQREVLGLRFFTGLTSGETARLLNRNDGSIREMQRAAIEKLRKLLSVNA